MLDTRNNMQSDSGLIGDDLERRKSYDAYLCMSGVQEGVYGIQTGTGGVSWLRAENEIERD